MPDPSLSALRDVLLTLRTRLAVERRSELTALIDAAFAGDVDAQVRALTGDARLTEAEFAVLRLIHESQRDKGYPPTFQEMADARGVSKVTIFEQVDWLIERGVLKAERYKSRSLRIVPRGVGQTVGSV